VYDGKEKIIYIDRKADARQSVSGNIGVNDQPVRIGGWGHSVMFFAGKIDEVALFNRALSADEISRLHQSVGKPKADEPGLVAYWSFDNDERVTVKDDSSNHNDGKLINTWSARHDKLSDPREFVKMEGHEGGFPYSLARTYIEKDQLPLLHKMLEDANYAPYWRNVARLIGYISDDPNSVPLLLSYFQKDDSYNFRSMANLGNLTGKIWSLALIGMIGGEQADVILRDALTAEGAARLAANWIDGKLVEDNSSWSDKNFVLSYIRNAAVHGLVYTGKQENIDIVRRMYFAGGADGETDSQMRMHLLEGVVIDDYIRHHGREAFFQLHGNKILEALDPYFIKYRVYEEQVQKNEKAEESPPDR
jgi:hypothetical protein